jgi:tetratricopeptide (TPR) repeat protein
MLAELPETAPTTATAPTEVTLEVRRHLRAGDAALAEGNVTKALEHFSLAVARDPSDLDALKAMAATLTVAGRHEEALDFHRMIARLLPGQRAPRFNCAMALARMRRFTEAQEQLLELLAEAPDDVRCRYNLAGIYQAQGKFDLAAETWDHVLKQGSSLAASDLAAAHTSHGQALSALSDHQRAMTAYAEAAKLRPDDLGAWLNLSAAAQSAGSYGRAIFAAKQAAALAPMEPALWNRLGEIWLELHRATNRPDCLKEALEAWRVSVRLKPDQPEISRLLRVYEPAASAPTTGASP